MENEKSGITSADVKSSALSSSPNPSTDTQILYSDIGAGVETGSTVGRDLTTNATSRMHTSSSSVSHHRNEDIKDAESRTLNTNAEQEGQESQASGLEGCISDLKPTTHNAYGGGIYGTDAAASPSKLARASDSQSAEGPTSDMHDDTHKYVKRTTSTTTSASSSKGGRGQDIVGQSYIQ